MTMFVLLLVLPFLALGLFCLRYLPPKAVVFVCGVLAIGSIYLGVIV